MKKNIYSFIPLLLTLILATNVAMASDTLVNVIDAKKVEHRVFSSIFFSNYVSINENVTPRSAFEMPTALLGYSATLSKKLKATIVFDVTRTTSDIQVFDTDGNELDVTYFSGSKYTAFLKMAEIYYSVNEHIDLRIGQLLNTQYLTLQDKFWGFRYVYFTLQEVHRYGSPADFGAQIDLKAGGVILNQISVTNGDGPFKHQDADGVFLFSNNFEVKPLDNLILKLYTDYAPAPMNTGEDKYTLSAFAGYKTELFRVGFEFSKLYNVGFTYNRDFYGYSAFGSVALGSRFDLFARYDYFSKSNIYNVNNGHFLLGGLQYKPHKNLFCSVNFRSLNPSNKRWIYTSFGVSF